MSWRPEVQTNDEEKWTGNALRFATREEAMANVRNLEARWFAVTAVRVIETSEEANYRWVAGEGLVSLDKPDSEPTMPAERVKI